MFFIYKYCYFCMKQIYNWSLGVTFRLFLVMLFCFKFRQNTSMKFHLIPNSFRWLLFPVNVLKRSTVAVRAVENKIVWRALAMRVAPVLRMDRHSQCARSGSRAAGAPLRPRRPDLNTCTLYSSRSMYLHFHTYTLHSSVSSLW